jgi:hydroxymethylglutaryl-CoA reductase
MDSRIPGFHRLTPAGRIAEVERRLAMPGGSLAAAFGLGSDVASLAARSEDVVAGLVLPLSIAPNFRVDGLDVLVPMATEEPSVVAAAANGARLLRHGDGISTTVGLPVMTGQVLVEGVSRPAEAGVAVEAAFPALRAAVAGAHPALAAAGGGLVRVRAAPSGSDLLVSLDVDVRDAMGANVVNDACERLAPAIEAASGGRALVRILTNACPGRLATASGRVPLALLDADAGHARELARRVDAISRFAERDADRAVTHNKGVCNGIDAVLLATGQDTRAAAAAAHAHASRDGTYRPLSSWRVEGDGLAGTLVVPLAVGTVGGAIESRPACLAALAVMGIRESRYSSRLAAVVAAAGLASNLAALLALAGEGIQAGHMRLHSRTLAMALGASPDEADDVAARLATEGGRVDRGRVERTLDALRRGKPA